MKKKLPVTKLFHSGPEKAAEDLRWAMDPTTTEDLPVDMLVAAFLLRQVDYSHLKEARAFLEALGLMDVPTPSGCSKIVRKPQEMQSNG